MMNKSMSVRLHFSVSISGAESPKAPVPLGMGSGAIFDSQITASSVYNDKRNRMLDCISKDPKTRLEMLAGQLE